MTLFSPILQSNRPSRKYILANILLNHTNIHNQAAIRKIKNAHTLANGNLQNIHPANIRDYTVIMRTIPWNFTIQDTLNKGHLSN